MCMYSHHSVSMKWSSGSSGESTAHCPSIQPNCGENFVNLLEVRVFFIVRATNVSDKDVTVVEASGMRRKTVGSKVLLC
jgi:hypothetical protein